MDQNLRHSQSKNTESKSINNPDWLVELQNMDDSAPIARSNSSKPYSKESVRTDSTLGETTETKLNNKLKLLRSDKPSQIIKPRNIMEEDKYTLDERKKLEPSVDLDQDDYENIKKRCNSLNAKIGLKNQAMPGPGANY